MNVRPEAITFTDENINSNLICMCICAQSLQPCPTLCSLWTVDHQVPMSMGFSRQNYWSGLPCLPPGDLPEPGIKSTSVAPALQLDSLLLSHWGTPPPSICIHLSKWSCGSDFKSKENKSKNNQMGPHQTEKFLHCEENHHQNEKATY